MIDGHGNDLDYADMIILPDIFLLRHGETEWNLTGRFQGREDSPLTTKGEDQALRQGYLLSTITDITSSAFVSPQGRAVRTAELALGKSWTPRKDDRLREIAFGEWEGKTRDEIKPEIACSFESGLWNFQSPGGENFEEISKRVSEFLTELDSPTVIITHGITSMVLRGLYLGLSIEQMLRLPLDQGCVFHLSKRGEVCLS